MIHNRRPVSYASPTLKAKLYPEIVKPIVAQKSLSSPSVDKLGLCIRAANSLWSGGIYTLNDLLQKTPDDLLELKNFGGICLSDVRSNLKQRGLHLLRDD